MVILLSIFHSHMTRWRGYYLVALYAGGRDTIHLNFGQETDKLTGIKDTGEIGPNNKKYIIPRAILYAWQPPGRCLFQRLTLRI